MLEEPDELEEDDTLENLAEDELRKCARLIEEAAAMLMTAKPRTKPRVAGVIEKEDIDEAILTATGAIASATNTLVKQAEITQHERRETSKATGKKYHIDEAWTDGLISAAQSVAASVQALVKAANGTVLGTARQGELVATARAVAQATAHLVAASKAKSDPNSAAVRKLGAAAKSVANATSKLVDAANQAARLQAEAEEDKETRTYTFAAAQRKELEQQMKIAELEANLEKERRKLAQMRRARYKK
jgi:talin